MENVFDQMMLLRNGEDAGVVTRRSGSGIYCADVGIVKGSLCIQHCIDLSS